MQPHFETEAYLKLTTWTLIAEEQEGEPVADNLGKKVYRLDIRIPSYALDSEKAREVEEIARAIRYVLTGENPKAPPCRCAGGPFNNSWVFEFEREVPECENAKNVEKLFTT